MINDGKEWGFEFKVCTRSRTYLFNAYSWNDREVWYKAFSQLIDYKKKILQARGLTIDDSKINIDDARGSTPPERCLDKTCENWFCRYDLRPSDFNEEGSIISIREAFEKYQEEAIKNIEEEERRKIEEEEAKRKAEQEAEGDQEGEGEEEGEADNQEEEVNEHVQEKESTPKKETNEADEELKKNFMSEESFLERLKDMKGSPGKRKKNPKMKTINSPQHSNSSEESEQEDGEIPDMEKLKNKWKSLKVNPLKTEGNLDSERGEKAKRKNSMKRKLKIKKKKDKNQPSGQTKVEKLNPAPKRFNTIAFNNDDDKKYDMVIDETDPDPEFLQQEEQEKEEDKKATQAILNKNTSQPIKLEPVRANRFDNGLAQVDEPAKKFYPSQVKPPSGKPQNHGRRQRTVERPAKNQFGDVRPMALLDKWEKQYGGIKDRQFYVKCDHDYDKWYTNENENNKFSRFNNPNNAPVEWEIQEDIPEDADEQAYVEKAILKKKVNKLEGSNSHREFEYDWDEDESMTYLKKFQDNNLKENYNKYGHQRAQTYAKPPKLTTQGAGAVNDYKPKKVPKKLRTERENARHYKSVAPQIDDWDE